MLLLTVFAFISLTLATIGIYGVLAYLVSQGTREIGIRMALGARPGDVMSRTLRSALLMLLVGLAAGLAGAARPRPPLWIRPSQGLRHA